MEGQAQRFTVEELSAIGSDCLRQWSAMHTACLRAQHVAVDPHCPFSTDLHAQQPLGAFMVPATQFAAYLVGGHNAWAAAACAVVLMQRLIRSGMCLTPYNIHRIGVVCLFLALKTHFDNALPISFPAAQGWMTNEVARECEGVLLTQLDWDVLVSREEVMAM
eukprot:TRINITY_DN753_c0_g3_i1.p1 TRINITY_DN753_c0_g3~~TRINITY_DN753_c0_g3_i1.p1  ORF type:complete len:163 (+),score=53.54 TRINITY_DN753_c0_g3_i1:99-587(+)